MLDGSPPVFDPSQFVFSVAEDQTEVGTVTATDPDNDISGYSLSGTDAADFEIDSSGKITATTMLDFEGQTTYQFNVIVEDAYSQTDTATVTVNVTDVAEDPVFGSPPGGGGWEFTISEMAHDSDGVGVIPLSDPQNDVARIDVYEGDISDRSTWVEVSAFEAWESAGSAPIFVIDEWQLDHESKPEWNLILEATDEYGNSGTTEVKVTLTDEVEWGSIGTFIVSWVVADPPGMPPQHHAEILIIPEDQETFGSFSWFTRKVWVDRQEMVYTTVGAGHDGGLLVSETDRSAIDEDVWTQRGTVETSGSENDMIFLIIWLDGQYGDDLTYAAFPEAPGADGWNSNSYARGLLNALNASDSGAHFNFSTGGAAFPGWLTPVPLAEFGIDEEEE